MSVPCLHAPNRVDNFSKVFEARGGEVSFHISTKLGRISIRSQCCIVQIPCVFKWLKWTWEMGVGKISSRNHPRQDHGIHINGEPNLHRFAPSPLPPPRLHTIRLRDVGDDVGGVAVMYIGNYHLWRVSTHARSMWACVPWHTMREHLVNSSTLIPKVAMKNPSFLCSALLCSALHCSVACLFNEALIDGELIHTTVPMHYWIGLQFLRKICSANSDGM